MIDSIDSLAFSIQANPGVYALLLGSGVSRAAQIPTGWEITLDLIRKLAAASGESAEPDPERWYREKYKAEPDYSKIIARVAGTQAEQQRLLRPYFEASQQEREENAKQPTAAHRAIAELVAKGFVKVIITTNFDRLVEKALEEAAIEPTVLSSPDQVKGMAPLVHTEHCIIKVHGDYRNTRLRNTPSELDKYPKEIKQLLDQIFDNFGLVVCGWSAAWDGALRDAILRTPSRRFTTYWAVLGEASDEAQRLIDHRHAQVIDIEDAGEFFEIVQQKVEAIEQFSRPHPLSTEAAVASLKRYLPEPRYRIQLSDIIDETIERAVGLVSTQSFNMDSPKPDSETVTARVRAYEVAFSTLLAMAPIGGHWAEEVHFDGWRRALERLATVPPPDHTNYPAWLDLKVYPATLALYALGLGALSSNKLQFLAHMFSTAIPQPNGRKTQTVVELLPPFLMSSQQGMRLLEGMERRRAPLNDWIHGTLRQYMGNITHNDEQYDLMFDKLEILMALGYMYHKRPEGLSWAPAGRYAYRSANRIQILEEVERPIAALQDESPLVKSRIFGDTAEECTGRIEDLKKFVSSLHWD